MPSTELGAQQVVHNTRTIGPQTTLVSLPLNLDPLRQRRLSHLSPG